MMLSASLWRMTSTPTWQDEIELLKHSRAVPACRSGCRTSVKTVLRPNVERGHLAACFGSICSRTSRATAIECGLIAVGISIAILVAVNSVGTKLTMASPTRPAPSVPVRHVHFGFSGASAFFAIVKPAVATPRTGRRRDCRIAGYHRTAYGKPRVDDRPSRPPALTSNFSAARLQHPMISDAKAFIPFHTPLLGSGDVAGPKLANTIDSYLIRIIAWCLAGLADLRDHAAGLMKSRRRDLPMPS